MSLDHTQLPVGIFFMQAQEQVVFGRPAAQAVLDELGVQQETAASAIALLRCHK